jgi:predicted transcriptional regulator of viral defense system
LEYLDSWMSYLGADYYVGWLSAAAIHGASHQAAQVTQVATSKTVQSRQIGRSRTEFYLRCGIREVPTTLHRVASGDVPVATPEATVLGISADVRLGAGIDNVANIIIELAAENALNGHRLAHIAHLFPASAVRRTGWMLENFTDLRGLGELKSLSGALPPTPSVLSPDSPRAGKVDRDWNLQINARLDPDV